ncbi:uncharacterized protein EI90DRAFT_3019442 [Cantharellus anzutake]|uniref:uncharacterized protein n=1 Tax=Cantharellus anzutake TaxID=1750568 RepID=UPI001903A6E0|nr:uncharacterized protein EI90DRAFT_3019442 [Cantharellus anzutake]KAF8324684.1 hypothetical protein EI90DRAFT_3019442 [Cantharellus anzutake]
MSTAQSRAGTTALANVDIRGLSLGMVIPDTLRNLSFDKAMAVTHSLREEAFIGICELPAHTEESLPLAFGVRNARPIDCTGLNGIIESIIDDNGPSRLRLDMPVTLMIRKPWVASSDWPRMITPDNYGGLPTLELTDVGRLAADAGKLQLLNGQHRITALRAAYEAVSKDVKKHKEATKGKSMSDLTTSEDKQLFKEAEKRLKAAEATLAGLQSWPAALYDLDILEQDEAVGSLIVELLARNKDVVEVVASDEEKLVPMYQHLLSVQVQAGWMPTLWRSAKAARTRPESINLDITALMRQKAGSQRKLNRIGADERSNRGLMELVRVGKYYRNWKGFTINHIATKLLGTACAVQNERLALLLTDSDADDDFDYQRFEQLLEDLDGKLSEKVRVEKTEELDDLALHFVKTYIDKVERMPALETYFDLKFWKGIEDAEEESGVTTIEKTKGSRGIVKTQRIYADDVFQFSHPDHFSRYVDYRSGVWKAIEKVVRRNEGLLAPSVVNKCQHRFNVLFSGVIHRWYMILMTNGLLAKFDEIASQYKECFREDGREHWFQTTNMFANIPVTSLGQMLPRYDREHSGTIGPNVTQLFAYIPVTLIKCYPAVHEHSGNMGSNVTLSNHSGYYES